MMKTLSYCDRHEVQKKSQITYFRNSKRSLLHGQLELIYMIMQLVASDLSFS